MTDRPENQTDNQRGNWHEPAQTSAWKDVQQDETPRATWRSVKALPDNVPEEPEDEGQWHLPRPEDTTFGNEDEIEVSDRPQQSSATAASAGSATPEDMLAEILSSSRRKTTAPEDTIPQEDTGTERASASEDYVSGADETGTQQGSSDTAERPEDYFGLADLEALGAMDDEDTDEDEDAFTVSEYLALAELEEQAQRTEDITPEDLEDEDLSPAQQAIFNMAQQAAQDLPDERSDLELDEAETVREPGGETAAEYARRMAQQLAEESDQAEAEQRIGDLMREGERREGEDPAAYARRMAQEYASGDVDTSPPEGTQLYQTEEQQQQTQPQQQQTQPQLSEQERELANKFRETRRQVQILRQQYNDGQMDYNELQNRLREHTILDDQNNWWMMGVESNQWYRYDNNTQQWVEEDPPVPLDAGSPRTETGQLDPDEVIAGSLPYLPDTGDQQQVEEDSNYDATQYNQAQQEYSQQFQREDDAPLPRPGQPQVDPDRTMVGESFDRDTLPGAAETVQNMRAVDSSQQQTVPSQPAYGGESIEAAYPGVREDSYAPEYDIDNEPVPDDYAAQGEREQTQTRNYAIIALVAIVVLAILGAGAAFGGALLWYNNTLEPYRPQINALANYEPQFQTARIMDANGDLIVELTSGEGAREPVQIEEGEVSPYFLHAVISNNNPDFYTDGGGDIVSAALSATGLTAPPEETPNITRTVVEELVLDGAAGIPQAEINAVAREVTAQYDKNEILNLYINELSFGNESFGVESAAQFYFDKPAEDLNLAESAMLAAILEDAGANDPIVNREQAFRATRGVIEDMIANGCIRFPEGNWEYAGQNFCIGEDVVVEDENGSRFPLLVIQEDGYDGLLSVQLAEIETRSYEPREAQQRYPHFVNYVQGEIRAVYGPNALFQRGFTVYTTLIPRVQQRAETELEIRVDQLTGSGVNTGAVLVADPRNGAIRAMVGSPDYADETINGSINYARNLQEAGNIIKPIVYAAAIEGRDGRYYTPSSILWDVPTRYPLNGETYVPVNQNTQNDGPKPLRVALQNSDNIPAVKTLAFIGTAAFRDMATRLGLSFQTDEEFSIRSATGTNRVSLFEMVNAYGTFANNGTYNQLYAIERITERGPDGEEVEVPLQTTQEERPAISPPLAYVMQNILSDDSVRNTFGQNSQLTLANLGYPTRNVVSAKSGTSNEGRDLWTIGFTQNAVVGVWLGTFDDRPTINQTGFTAAAPLWNAVMREAVAGRNPQEFQIPSGVLVDAVCRPTGTLAPQGADCINGNRVTDIYLQNQPPPPPSEGFVQTVAIDSWTGLRANQFCQENVVEEVFADIDDPSALNWLNNTQQGQQTANNLGLPNNLNPPPQQECQPGQRLPAVSLANPTDGQTVQQTLSITGQISADNLARWQLQVAPAGTNNFQPITQARTEQITQNGTLLTTWDTRQVNNGQYTLRLEAYSTEGGYIFRNVNITVDNPPPPTPTPAPTLTPTSPPAVPSPLPFDPTPTATLGAG
jgi:membrane peptidoglycan carboxypeptidase